MKTGWSLPLFLLVACAASQGVREVPVDVLGDGDPDLLLGFSVLRADHGQHGVVRDVDGEQVGVSVPLPPATRLRRVVVESEEGVDVVTLIVDAARSSHAVVCTLRLERREHQLALVVQDEVADTEATVAVFAPF